VGKRKREWLKVKDYTSLGLMQLERGKAVEVDLPSGERLIFRRIVGNNGRQEWLTAPGQTMSSEGLVELADIVAAVEVGR
jgi:hypothetical protein